MEKQLGFKTESADVASLVVSEPAQQMHGTCIVSEPAAHTGPKSEGTLKGSIVKINKRDEMVPIHWY